MEPVHCHRLSLRCQQFRHCRSLRPIAALAAASGLGLQSVWQQGRLPCPASAVASAAAAREVGPNPRSMLRGVQAAAVMASWGRMPRVSEVEAPRRSLPAAPAPVANLQIGTTAPSPVRTGRSSEAGCTTARTTRMPLPQQGSAEARQKSKQDAGSVAVRRSWCRPRSRPSPFPAGAVSIASVRSARHVALRAAVRRQVLLISTADDAAPLNH